MSIDDLIPEFPEPATPGPWGWFGNVKRPQNHGGAHTIYLATRGYGRSYVMAFSRLGMRGGQPQFQVYRDNDDPPGSGIMTDARDLAVYEVDYRDDVVDIDHPDARAITALPDLHRANKALREMVAFVDDWLENAVQDHYGEAVRHQLHAIAARHGFGGGA